jgi:hypothetical protein
MRAVNTILICAVALWTIDFAVFDGIYFRSIWELLALIRR